MGYLEKFANQSRLNFTKSWNMGTFCIAKVSQKLPLDSLLIVLPGKLTVFSDGPSANLAFVLRNGTAKNGFFRLTPPNPLCS